METLKKVFLSVCILFCASNLWADAYYERICIDGIYYNLSYPNATVTCASNKYNSYSGKITIPETVTYGSNTYNVTTIGENAFRESTGLTSVSLPESITSIGDRAFYNCSGLTTFTIPNKVTTIGNRAFSGCSGITTITIPEKVSSIDIYAFYGCSNLEEVNFNATECSVTSSATHVGPFYGSKTLLKVNIGDNVSAIPDYLFVECTGLIDMTIPNNVTKIGAGAFYKCTGLKSVTIQDGTEDLYYCRGVGRGLSSDGSEIEIYYDSFTGCEIDTLYVGRNMVYDDTYSPFKENTSLSSLTIGGGVTSINEYDFCDCTNLIEVYFNATKYASEGTSDSSGFLRCTNFSKVNIGDNVTIVPTYLFNDCTSLTEVNFNATACASAGTSDHPAFSGCTSLSRVNIGDNVTKIPENLFKDCTSLTEVNYNATACASAGSSDYPAFSGCTSLSRVNIGDNVTMVPAYLFKDCTGLEEIAIPENIASIGNCAFSNCTRLAEVRYGASSCTLAGSIDYPIFNECTNLSIISIGDNVSIIPPCLLYGCSGIMEINVPNGVVEIGENAFGNCSGLKTLTIEDGAETLTMATSASSTPFSGCPIETLHLGRDVSYDDSYSPFRDNTSLTSLTIGEKVTTLDEYEFYGCSSLTGVTSLNLVPPMLCSNTFENVTNVEVPKSALNTYALADKWVDIPIIYANDGGDVYYPVPIFYEGNMAIVASGGEENGTVATKGGSIEITPIEKNNLICGLALHDTKDITEELINENSYSFVVSEYHKGNTLYTYSAGDEHSFDVTLSQSGQLLEEITVSKVNDVYYLKVRGDLNGTDILTIRRMSNLRILDIEGANIVKGGECYYSSYETSNNEVGVYFFTDMSSLKQVKLPASAVTIGGYAFNNCSDLMTMAIPSKITSIGSSAFYGCSKLVDITIPNSVTRIYNSAYADCAKLRFVTIEDSDNSLSIMTSKNSIDGSVSTPFTRCPIETLYLGRNMSYSNDISPFGEISTLKTLTIGNKATTISSCAFENCVGLTELIIGSKVASISNNAFDGCLSLAEIDSKNPTPPTITSNTFSGVDKKTCVLKVPSGSINAYWIHVYWGEFLNINEVDFPDDIDPDGIDNVLVDNNDIQIRDVDGTLVVTGDVIPVYVYTINGMLIGHDIVQGEKSISLPQGNIYIVKAGTQTMKVKM